MGSRSKGHKHTHTHNKQALAATCVTEKMSKLEVNQSLHTMTHMQSNIVLASGCFEHFPTIDISKKRNMGNNTVTQHAAPPRFLPDKINDNNFIEDPMQIRSNTSPRKSQ